MTLLLVAFPLMWAAAVPRRLLLLAAVAFLLGSLAKIGCALID